MNKKEKILAECKGRLAHFEHHTTDQFLYVLRVVLNAQESEEHGLARIKVEHCDCDNCVAMRKEIAKRVWWEYEDYVGKLGVGAVSFLEWLDKDEIIPNDNKSIDNKKCPECGCEVIACTRCGKRSE